MKESKYLIGRKLKDIQEVGKRIDEGLNFYFHTKFLSFAFVQNLQIRLIQRWVKYGYLKAATPNPKHSSQK